MFDGENTVSYGFSLQTTQVTISNFILFRRAPGARIKVLNSPQHILPIIALEALLQ